MLTTNIKRIIKSAVSNFWRSRSVSLSAILVMTITLFVFVGIIFSNAVLDSALNQIKSKVDINVYLTTGASEEDILFLKNSLEKLPEISLVEYVSREQALKNFKEKHKDDQLTLEALNELQDNPLGAVLNIQAKETNQYENIAKFLDNESVLSRDGITVIDKINYYQNKIVIDRLTKIISATEQAGFIIALLLVIISAVITFNTIRLAIYISREEISVMRLVGASRKYVRGPFVVEGILYGLTSAFIVLVLSLLIAYYIGDFSSKLFGLNLFDYYLGDFFRISGIIVLSGIVLGAVASFLAVRKYLKV